MRKHWKVVVLIFVIVMILFMVIIKRNSAISFGEIIENEYYAISVLGVNKIDDLEEFAYGGDIYSADVVVYNLGNSVRGFNSINTFYVRDNLMNLYSSDESIPVYHTLDSAIEPGGKIRGEVMFRVVKDAELKKIQVQLNEDSDAYYYSLDSELKKNHQNYITLNYGSDNYKIGEVIETDLFNFKVNEFNEVIENDFRMISVDLTMKNNSSNDTEYDPFWLLTLKDEAGRLYHQDVDFQLDTSIQLQSGETEDVTVNYRVPVTTSEFKLNFEPKMNKNELYIIDLK
ncbi:MAG: DUF4352 domain-containing protein [Clostridiales bacterium]|nr:DUF4352 domain-containing protein [Clostridiales bacterium]